jgi:glycosyltransferase involved in cell wall biosynthesis
MPSNVPVRGYVIGGPIYQTQGSQCTLAELQLAANQLGLAGKIGFTGFLEDTSAAMRSLDVVVHASTQPEPFGMVIIEGMACERAVVASRAGGAAELVEEGRNALSHPPGDAAALAHQILRLAMDPQLRSRLGKGGRLSAEQHYGREGMARAAVALYQRVSEKSSHVPAQAAPQAREPELSSSPRAKASETCPPVR